MVLRSDPQLPDGYGYTQPSFTSDGVGSVGCGFRFSVKTLAVNSLALLKYELSDSTGFRLYHSDKSCCICFGCVVINFAYYVLGATVLLATIAGFNRAFIEPMATMPTPG